MVFAVVACGGSFRLQLAVFTAISALPLACVRPFVKRYVNRGIQKTNTGSLVGKPVRITEEVNNSPWTGKGVVEGMEWTVRAKDPGCVFPIGMSAKVVGIQGVKLIVTKITDETV